MNALASWLKELESAARTADGAEEALRAEFARRVAALAEDRAFAYRRMKFMQTIVQVVARCEEEQTAVAHSVATLRNRLGWSHGREAHDEIAARFALVCAAIWASREESEDSDPAAALAAFESCYREARGGSFWTLFEHHIPETPLVDY